MPEKAYAQAFDAPYQARLGARRLTLHTPAVALVVAREDIEEDRRVLYRPRDWPGVIAAFRKRDDPDAAYAAERRFESDGAAQPRRAADRSAGVGPERGRHQACGD